MRDEHQTERAGEAVQRQYLDGQLIRVEPGREGSPVCHVVWDSYAQREVRTYPLTPGESTDEIQRLTALLGWAYGKLARVEFGKMEDALAMDEIKLLLTDPRCSPTASGNADTRSVE